MNKSLRHLFICNGIFVFASSILGPLYALFVEKIAPGIFPVSLSWAIFMISGTIFTYLTSKIHDDVIKKEYMLMLSYLVRSATWFMFIFTHSLAMLIILQIILCLGEALGNPAFDSIFAEHLDKNKHIHEYSVWKIVEKFAAAGATLLGGIIVNSFGFSTLFLLMSSLALASTVDILINPKRLEK